MKSGPPTSLRNGDAVLKDTTVSLPPIDTLHFGGSYNGFDSWNGHIKQVHFYPTIAMTDEQLQELTS